MSRRKRNKRPPLGASYLGRDAAGYTWSPGGFGARMTEQLITDVQDSALGMVYHKTRCTIRNQTTLSKGKAKAGNILMEVSGAGEMRWGVNASAGGFTKVPALEGALEPLRLLRTRYKVRIESPHPGFVLSGKSHPKGMAPGRMQWDHRPEGVILAHTPTQGTWGPKQASSHHRASCMCGVRG